ncbi:MAG: tetratricopeptide repeat protein, partial [Phycisphaerales bacterium]|nr:tetratricopeptide repeat protein [Phycisphaerales bacterium]
IEALRQQIDRAKDDDAKRTPRYRLVEALLAAGRQDEALEALGELANPRDPSSYERVGILLHYYGRHDAALEKFEAAKRSKSGGGGWGGAGETGDAMIARSLLIKGDVEGAADRIVSAVAEQMRQSTQYGGMMSMYGMYNDDDENHFQPFSALFVMRPSLAKEILDRLEAEYASSPDDPLAAKRLLMLHKTMGRPDLADKVLEKLIDKSMSDQALAMRLIDRAIERREYEKAASMAREFIDNQPKPQVPPGMPPQYAGMIQLMSARNMMTCKLGDIYWKMNQPDKAFEEYNKIRDEKVDLTNVAYAAICVIRGRVEEAKTLLDQTLAAQDVDSPLLLQFRAVIAVLDDDANMAFDLLEQAARLSEGDQSMMTPFGGGGGDPSSILGSLAEATGLFDRYVEFLRDRIKKNPNDWSNHEGLAELLRRHGRYDDAVAVLDKAARVKALRRQVMSERV